MLIVIDYDETFTAQPDMWVEVIRLMESRGNTVICCTNRVGNKHADADVIADMKAINIPVVFAANAKYRDKFDAVTDAGYAAENAIWIDDCPEFILQRRADDMPSR